MERLSVTSRYDCAVCICLCLLPAAWMAGHARGSWNTEELNRKAKGMHRIPFRLERIPAISDHDAMIPSFQLSNSFVESECGTAFKPLPHRKPQATEQALCASGRWTGCAENRHENRTSKQVPEPRPGATVQTRRALGAAPASRPPCYQIPTLRGYDTLRNAFSRASVKRQNIRATESGHVVGGGAEGVAIGFWETQQPAHGPGSGALSPVYALSRCQ